MLNYIGTLILNSYKVGIPKQNFLKIYIIEESNFKRISSSLLFISYK